MASKKAETIRVRLNGADLKELDSIAAESNLNRSELTRRIIHAFFLLMKTPLWELLKPVPEIESPDNP